jgi:hypothetical protein
MEVSGRRSVKWAVFVLSRFGSKCQGGDQAFSIHTVSNDHLPR